MATLVPVRETYLRSGVPVRGAVQFTASAGRILDSDGSTLITGPVTGQLVAGVLSVSLPASDDPSLSPSGFTYRVRELFNGGSEYTISVPLSGAAAGVELSSLAQVPELPASAQAAFVASVVESAAATADGFRIQGAKGDGTTDDTAAIVAAVAAAKASGRVLRAAGTFRINSTVTIDCHADLSNATLVYYGTGLAVQVGAVSPVIHRVKVALPKVIYGSKPTTGWTAGTTGVKVVNTYAWTVGVPHVQGFETDLLVYGESGNGTSYTTFHLGHLDNGKVDLKLDAAPTGWVNQNLFLGGRLSHNSAEGTAVAGTRHIQAAQTTNIINGNLFVGTSIESPNVVEYHIEMYGQQNLLLNPRLENTGGDAARRIWSRGTAKGNRIIGGFNTGQITQVLSDTAYPFDVDSDVQRAIRAGSSGIASLLLENKFSNAHPALTIMEAGAGGAGTDPETGYAWRVTAQQLAGKRASDSFNRFVMDGLNGRLYLGDATVAPAAYFAGAPTSILLGNGHLYFLTDNAFDIGSAASLRPRYIRAATAVRTGAFATGSRPAAATAGVGAMVWDSTLGKPVWSTGSAWVDATGAVV